MMLNSQRFLFPRCGRSNGLLSRFNRLWLGGFLPLTLAAALSPKPVVAAERVTLTYGFAEISTSVESLRAYGERGEINSELAPYINFLNEEQRSQFRQTLQLTQDVSPVEISQFLYSSLGENILRYLGDIVRTQGRLDGAKALRGALVLAAAEPEGFSLLGVLDNFPTHNVRIDSQRAFRALNAVTGLIEDTDSAIAAIERQAKPRTLVSPTVPKLPVLAQPGPDAVTTQTLMVVDEARNRSLTTDLYLPDRGSIRGGVPVIVISHGLAGDRKGFVNVAQHLASHGFAVAALDHPGSDRTQLEALLSGSATEVADPTEFSDRPRDVSYLLDELTRLSQPNGPFANRFDLEQVGIIGHSFGGYTALALAGAKLNFETLEANCESDEFIYNAANPSMVLQCTALLAPAQFNADLRDERIQAVMAMNPVTSSLFGPEGFSQIAIPTLLVSGSEDPLAPALLEQIRPFTWLNQPLDTDTAQPVTDIPSHYLALIQGGSHLYDPPDQVEGAEASPLASELINADIPLAHSYLKALSLGFMQAEVERNPIYRNALDDASIVQLGQQPLPLLLVDSLTEEMLNPPAPEVPEVPEAPEAPEDLPMGASPIANPVPDT